MPQVWIPSAMQVFTHGEEIVAVNGKNIRELIENMEMAYPGMKQALMAGDRLKPDVAVLVDGRNCQLGLRQPLSEDNEVFFVPAISGG